LTILGAAMAKNSSRLDVIAKSQDSIKVMEFKDGSARLKTAILISVKSV